MVNRHYLFYVMLAGYPFLKKELEVAKSKELQKKLDEATKKLSDVRRMIEGFKVDHSGGYIVFYTKEKVESFVDEVTFIVSELNDELNENLKQTPDLAL